MCQATTLESMLDFIKEVPYRNFKVVYRGHSENTYELYVASCCWGSDQPERSKREDLEKGCGTLNIAEMQ